MLEICKAADGTSYTDRGQGDAVVLVHGGEASSAMALAEALAASHRVIAMGIEGFPDAPGPAAASGQLRRLLDDLGITAANVIGHAQGAAVAVDFTLAHPMRVLRLALLNPPAEALAGKMANIRCPALLATGAADTQSPPDVLRALALAAGRGRAAVVDGAADLLAASATLQLVKTLLAERLSTFDARELRSAFGSFMTGVTIVTTTGPDGAPRGFTANSFTSVSIEPPLLLICVGKAAASREVFAMARGFAINILSEHQKDISVLFASKRADKFQTAAWREGPYGNPLIDGAAAWFDCARHQVIDAGDHIILLGHIEAFSYSDANPLGYARGGYITLGLEQAAVNAASSSTRTVVGAILESDGKLVLLPNGRPSGLTLPEVGRSGANGSASQLHAALGREGIESSLGFLFAVFENPETKEQCIYYRGEALLHARGRVVLADFNDLPWDKLPDEVTRSMLRRYSEERKIGRFKIYSGDHRQGMVKSVD